MNLIISSKLTSNPNRSSPKKHQPTPKKPYKMFSKLIVAALASAGVASALPTAPGQSMNLQTLRIKTKPTSSVSPELLQLFAHSLAHVAFLQNLTLLAMNMKAIWQASLLNNSGETEKVIKTWRVF